MAGLFSPLTPQQKEEIALRQGLLTPVPSPTGSLIGDIGNRFGKIARGARDAASFITAGPKMVIDAGGRGTQSLFEQAPQLSREFAAGFTQNPSLLVAEEPVTEVSDTIDSPQIEPQASATSSPLTIEEQQKAAAALSNLNNPDTPNEAQDVVEATEALKKSAGEVANIALDKPANVDKGLWDSINDEFDLTTVGLALLSTSANGQPLAANLGLALEAGKLAKTRKLEKAESKAAAQAKAKLDAETRAANKKEQAAKISKLEAETNKINAETQSKLGDNYEPASATQLTIGQSVVANVVGADSYKDVPPYLGQAYYDISQQIRASGDKNPKSIQDRTINQLMKLGYFEDTSWFVGPDFEIADVLGN